MDDPGNANFQSLILMHYMHMIKYYYIWLRMQYRKLLTNTNCRIASVANPASSPWMCDLGITDFFLKREALLQKLIFNSLKRESDIIWAVTCGFQQFDILTSVDSEEPLQPPFKLRNSKWCSVSSYNNHRILKRLAKALIRLRICSGWSEALLVAHTTLLEISCYGSIIIMINMHMCWLDWSRL